MFKKQLGLILAIIVTSLVFTSNASAINTGQVTIFRTIHSGWAGPVQAGATGYFNLSCAPNEHVVSGGFRTRAVSGNSANGFRIIHSYPTTDRNWRLRLRNADDIARDVSVYIVCAE